MSRSDSSLSSSNCYFDGGFGGSLGSAFGGTGFIYSFIGGFDYCLGSVLTSGFG